MNRSKRTHREAEIDPDHTAISTRRVLIVNAYSTLNRGDAVILDGLIAALRDAGAREITVAAPADPAEEGRRRALGADQVVPMVFDLLQAPTWIRRTYPLLAVWAAWAAAGAIVRGVIMPRSDAALRAYTEADLVVSSGGAYIGGRRPGINLVTGFQIAVAALLRRPCVVAPVTVKPMSRSVAVILGIVLRRAAVFARDTPSAERLAAIGVDAVVSSDLAFRSPSARRSADLRPDRRRPLVAWAPRQFATDSDVHRIRHAIHDAAIRAVSAVVRARGADLLIVAQSTADGVEDDAPIIARAMRDLPEDIRVRTELVVPRDIADAMARYASADLLYAFRMHAAIMALIAGTPALVVAYEAKVPGVFDLIGLGDWVVTPADAVDAVNVADRLLSLSRDDAKARIDGAIALARELDAPFMSELRRRLGSAGD